MQKRPPVPIIVIVVLAIIAFPAYYFYSQAQIAAADGALTASGTVETTEIIVGPEVSGKVTAVLAAEGDLVKAGDVLMHLDDTLLKAQRNQSAAALDTAKSAALTADAVAATAQAQYDLALSNAENAAKDLRIADWKTSTPADFNQPLWYFSQADQLSAAQEQVKTAQTAFEDADANLNFVEEKSTSTKFMGAEKRLLQARAAFLVAQDVLDRSNAASDGKDLKDEAQTVYDDALQELKDAQKAYDDALTTEGATDVLTARAKLAVALENVNAAKDRVRGLQTGAFSLQVSAAQKALEQAQTAAEQAHTAVNQAQANLELIDAQMSKLEIVSPIDGVILTRAVEPGEIVSPATQALKLGLLSDLTITVYVPEDRYGELSLGQNTDVVVDSFPGKTFAATVVHISSEAEFTPRNVQTAEGRSTTVYAIKLSVHDPDGQLKPGMPADVTFR